LFNRIDTLACRQCYRWVLVVVVVVFFKSVRNNGGLRVTSLVTGIFLHTIKSEHADRADDTDDGDDDEEFDEREGSGSDSLMYVFIFMSGDGYHAYTYIA